MIGYLNLTLRLVIWFLLTANLSVVNIIIGICVVFLIPHSRTAPTALKEWLQMLWKIIVAVPQAYLEAFELMFCPHTQETVTMERAKPRRSPGLIFLDIFLITFTPKTIVVKYHEEGCYEVHRVQRRKGR
ncbi:MAG: cation:proton antiporter [Myxacorys chilensis ATA2-1-KO14]|jgi:multicomponent Na+:H+ antiporter subunit E|nr:cation:proton antiporter [Myxacorys chilensis ATA2-1-KO14]